MWYQVYATDPKDNKTNQESFFSIAAIAGIVIGSLVGAITLIAVTCCIVCYCVVKRKEDSNLV
ncbi:hypothetical protein KP79_PYT11291 [Mizuhopecten yessoensis]|uniref:Uncharacterized protein n=1 Tax=Mizuhopecten yessoensis TaxID=6573 RepID=A0A210R752_MIZYE|nr:hypothetical protein KP79_PYT11291 [Mizuhopecten yessoensis]